jgi:hypothetical protein
MEPVLKPGPQHSFQPYDILVHFTRCGGVEGHATDQPAPGDFARGGSNRPRYSTGHDSRDTRDDVENLSQIWAVAPALVKLALRDDRRSQTDKEPPWKRIAEVPRSAT